MWSRTPNGKAVVFIHGFLGDSVTWDGFPSMILRESRLSGYDVFFLEYPWADRAMLTATIVKDFFDDLFERPEKIFVSELRRIGREASNYTEVTIVAHCFGAIITRLALLDAHEQGYTWVAKTKALLFAPAHLGADVVTLGQNALGIFGEFASASTEMLKTKFPALIDLEAEDGNATLESLRNRTQHFIDLGTGQFTIACEVLFGTDDRLVIQGQFCSDPPFRVIPSVGHYDICKPTASFTVPFDSLLSHLK
jgi:pimeloyl-ACP methyl ester carboxylesterase